MDSRPVRPLHTASGLVGYLCGVTGGYDEVEGKFHGVSAGAVLMLAASGANADGYRRGGPVYSSPWNWTGFYIGGHAGYAWSDVTWDNVSLTGEPVSNDDSGFIGGGQVGYNWQFGQVVLGIEGTYRVRP